MNAQSHLTFTASMWQREGSGGSGSGGSRWFATIPQDMSQDIRLFSQHKDKKPGGSIPVYAIIGFVTRKTSIFYDSKLQSYLLPIKSEVRKKLHLQSKDVMEIQISLL